MPPKSPKRSKRAARTGKVGRETSLERRPSGSREERLSFLLLCEGKTEKDYFTGMRTWRGPQLAVDAPKCDHRSLVREAGLRRSDEYDEVWCILDTELDDQLVQDLIREAQKSEVNLALSSPSFEFWLILHTKEHSRPFMSARAAEKELKAIRPGWSKSSTKFQDFEDGLEDACTRARKLHDGEGLPPNPSSAVWRLVGAIRRGGE
ncbi:RloB domain-containing protein [Actinomadura sp. GC306]|uniref:RloB family protein n=1 Tax=Actinomadura sp. GC306 TaxID=2530367 RepID=UPI0010488600|nr:RloB family protein [Actinomadura sp. GC306]TDC60710.1 RloB domain-containing protein [Actinomadura sp. GC306]